VADPKSRPDVPAAHGNESEHRRMLAVAVNAMLPRDGSKRATHPVLLASFAVADLPSATLFEGGIVYVNNQSTGAEPAFSDGTNWRIFSTRAIVS
jgi:hypothetical protein